MENDNKKLYDRYRENALLITKLQKAENLFRRQLNHSAGVLVSEISNDLNQLGSYPQYVDPASFQKGVLNIISALQSQDYSLCADSLALFIDTVLVPMQNLLCKDLAEYISDIYSSIASETNDQINLEETIFGYPALQYHSDNDIYLCSITDPMAEAFTLAKENFAPEAEAYHIWGMGLGYHVYALYRITNGSTDIYVYDNDHFLFDIAKSEKIGPWQSVFNDPKIHFVADPEIAKFSHALSNENDRFFIHMPSLLKLPENNSKDAERKIILSKIHITLNSFADQKDDIYINFYKNIKNADGFAEELFDEYSDQTIILAAAGPSLDKNIDVLKKALDEGIPLKVICVGTVLRKFLKKGITPDAFFVTDPAKGTYAQIEGLEHMSVPMILNTSAYYGFAQNYIGKKFLACQKHFELSEKLGHRLFNTGGSVTTLALDFAIQAKAKKIITIGCDMAFTGNMSHASGTALKHSTQDDKVIQIKGYYGDTVNTGLLLSLYREWIEKRLEYDDTSNIEFFNSTEGGAYIEGMKHISLSDALK